MYLRCGFKKQKPQRARRVFKEIFFVRSYIFHATALRVGISATPRLRFVYVLPIHCLTTRIKNGSAVGAKKRRRK